MFFALKQNSHRPKKGKNCIKFILERKHLGRTKNINLESENSVFNFRYVLSQNNLFYCPADTKNKIKSTDFYKPYSEPS